MALKIFSLIILLVLIIFSFILKDKQRKLQTIVGISLIIIGLIFSYGISFSPKASYSMSQLFLGEYQEEYEIDNKVVVISKEKDKYKMHKISKFLFIYYCHKGEVEEVSFFPVDYISEDNKYFFNLQYLKINDKYLFLTIDGYQPDDELNINGQPADFINNDGEKNYRYFVLPDIPITVKYNDDEMNIFIPNK